MWIGMARGSLRFRCAHAQAELHRAYSFVEMLEKLIEPTLSQVLDFCAEDPVERVFLEDIARRGMGRFAALAANGRLSALCHVGANVVPSGEGCRAFAETVRRGRAR